MKAQANYDIQFSLFSVDCSSNTVCYNVQLKSSDNSWNLAGQNYRLYYDGALGSFQSGNSLLGNSYQNFTLVQDIQNVDANGTGNLSFEGDLSFLNYTIDLSNTSTGGTSLPTDGSWLTTSQLCFAVQPALLNDPNTCFEAIWARMDTTANYATSFVEVSEWVSSENTQMANGVGYNDLESSAGEASCLTNSCGTVGSYDIQMSLHEVDCINNNVCYNVQLRSSNGNMWNLAGQNYRLYYNGALGSYLSGSSLLSNTDYSGFTIIQDIQNADASGTGNLSFEGDLSFLNYTIDLSNTSTGGTSLPTDGSWLTTSQLCFAVQPELLNDGNECFEAIWARVDTTAAYATSFVEVSEWRGADSTQMANGVGYNDLISSDNEKSCFDLACRYDYGDLQDATTSSSSVTGYPTYLLSNGPRHLITPGLFLGDTVDIDTDGLASNLASGDDSDGIDDEDGIQFFPSLNIFPGGKIRISLDYSNTTGDTAYIKAWIDWDGNGTFLENTELVFDEKDAGDGLFDKMDIAIPFNALTGKALGFRIRISNQDNMPPSGGVASGEVEDYLMQVSCSQKVCLPISVTRTN